MNNKEELYSHLLSIYISARDTGEDSKSTINLVDKLHGEFNLSIVKDSKWRHIADDIIEVNKGIFDDGRTSNGVFYEYFDFIDKEKDKSPIINQLREEVKKDFFDKKKD